MRNPDFVINANYKGVPVQFKVFVMTDGTELDGPFTRQSSMVNLRVQAHTIRDGKEFVGTAYLHSVQVDMTSDVTNQVRPHVRKCVPIALQDLENKIESAVGIAKVG